MLRSHPNPVLLTPGPTPLHDDAVNALTLPMLGHMDAEVLNLNAEIQADLRTLYGAPNAFTALLSGTGSLGMEAGFANLVEPNDDVLVLVNGTFGARMAEMAARYGANVRVVSAPLGEAIDPDAVARHVNGARLVALVHGETSTGVLNPLHDIARVVRADSDALLCVDAVTTVGMGPFDMEGLGIDYAYTGSQKCLSAPPGVAPIAISARAQARFDARRAPTPLWYCDFGGLRDYWEKRSYHHTVPVNLHFALHAALRAALREGLDARAARAHDVGAAVLAALEPLGFTPFVRDDAARLPTVLALRLPLGLNDADLRGRLRARGICITGGLGETAGLIWRLGLMGESARPHLYRPFLAALEDLLGERGLVRRFDAALSLQVAAD